MLPQVVRGRMAEAKEAAAAQEPTTHGKKKWYKPGHASKRSGAGPATQPAGA